MAGLPAEKPIASSWREVAIEIALAVALVVAFNVVVDRYLDLHPANRAKAVVALKWQLALHPPPAPSWVVLGDSSANQGVDTRLLADHYGKPALNLATVGDFQLVGDAWILQTLFESGARPQRILVVHVHDVWARSLEQLLHVVTRLRPPVDVARLDPPLAWQWGQRFELAWNHHFVNRFPFYTQNESLYWLLMNPRKMVAPPRVPLDASGFEIEPEASPASVSEDANELRMAARGGGFTVAPHQRAALETIARLAAEHGATVYLAAGPLADELANDADLQKVLAGVAAFLEAFAQDHPNVQVLSPLPFWLPADLMQSADHATEEGARRFTSMLIANADEHERGSGERAISRGTDAAVVRTE